MEAAQTVALDLSDALQELGLDVTAELLFDSSRVLTFRLKPQSRSATVSSIRQRMDDLGVMLEAHTPRLRLQDGQLILEVRKKQFNPLLFTEALPPQDPSSPRFVPLVDRLLVGVSTTNQLVAPHFDDLPHLLVGATTGGGKSVALHTMIMGILSSATPAETRIILFDPKQMEFQRYNDVPHLACPVTWTARAAARVLRGMVQEMENRYTRLAAGEPIGPRLVLFCDEYADLAGQRDDIEALLIRLAQKARAAKIHLVLATQRPSASIVNGNLKANFPSRMALRTASAVDSRIILDTGGAECLLGKGDALLSVGGDLTRLQVPWVSGETFEKVLAHYRGRG